MVQFHIKGLFLKEFMEDGKKAYEVLTTLFKSKELKRAIWSANTIFLLIEEEDVCIDSILFLFYFSCLAFHTSCLPFIAYHYFLF